MDVQGGPVDGAIAADFDSVADFDVAEVRYFPRPAVGVYGIAEAVAADAGMRVYLALIADPAAGAHENMRMQHGSIADPGIVFHHRMRADHAVVADARAGPDHTVGAEKRPFADRGIRVHHRGGMAFPPLSEPIALPVEVFQ